MLSKKPLQNDTYDASFGDHICVVVELCMLLTEYYLIINDFENILRQHFLKSGDIYLKLFHLCRKYFFLDILWSGNSSPQLIGMPKKWYVTSLTIILTPIRYLGCAPIPVHNPNNDDPCLWSICPGDPSILRHFCKRKH